MAFTEIHAAFVGTVLEGFFFGLYTVHFTTYLRIQRRSGKNRIFEPLALATILLYLLCATAFGLDASNMYYAILPDTNVTPSMMWKLNWISSLFFSIVDYLAQMILVYRCWIIWNKRYWVVLLPALMALAALGGEFALVAMLVSPGPLGNPAANPHLRPTGLAAFLLSLLTNTLVSLLIILKLLTVISSITSTLHPRHHAQHRKDSKYKAVIAVLIETGLAMFVAQLLWLVLFEKNRVAYVVCAGSIVQVYGLTPTLLSIRVRMDTTYEKESQVGRASSLAFASQKQTQSSHTMNPDLDASMHTDLELGTVASRDLEKDDHPDHTSTGSTVYRHD